jgi:hypothetical protein
MKKFSKKECFDFYRVHPKNNRWSWCGRNTEHVVIALWQDRFRKEDDGKLIYHIPPLRAVALGRPAYAELVENLEFARKNFDGTFKVIMILRKNPNWDHYPHEVKECWPKPEMRMKLRSLDLATGEWSAEALST